MTDIPTKSASQLVLDKPHPLRTPEGQTLVARFAKNIREKVLARWGTEHQDTEAGEQLPDTDDNE